MTNETKTATEMSAGHVMDELVARGRELYSLPKIALDVIDLTSQPQTDATALRKCVECDPALTARILRVVNSALFGLSSQVTDLTHAIGLLGIKPLKLLVLGFSLPPALFDGLDEEALEAYWKTSLIRAAACREIARETRAADVEESFIVGLLEGLGTLLLIQHLRDTYTQFYLQVMEQSCDLAEVEREQIGFDHRQLTSRLLQQWQFPQALVQAIACPSYGPLPPGVTALANVLRIAEHLTQLLAFPGSHNVQQLIADADELFGLSLDQVRQLVDRLEGSVPPLAEIFAIQWDQEQYLECLETAHRAMSELAVGPGSRPPAGEPAPVERFVAQGKSVRSALESWMSGGPGPRAAESTRPASRSANLADEATAPKGARRREASVDPGLLGRLRQAVVIARQHQRSVGLCLFEYDHADQIEMALGVGGTTALEELMRRVVETELEPSMAAFIPRNGQVAAICIGHDRTRMTRSARRILQQLASRVECELNTVLPTLPAAGAAIVEIPPRNLDPIRLVDAAERCLYAAHAAGGHTVKTIEL